MSPYELEKLREMVEALPKKKQEKWHDVGKNENGTFRKLRYFNGDFQIKVIAGATKGNYMIPPSGWAPVIASGSSPTMKQVTDAYGEEVVKAMEEYVGGKIDAFSSRSTPNHQRVQDACLLMGSFEGFNSEMYSMIKEHETGNHYRNKSLNVPTRPGQPVRG